jgi:molybdopterin/thiamine biosynthesis adenylyltransferase
MILVDFDLYEPKNLSCQEIASGEVGRSKVRVQARRLKRINPGLHVEPIRARVENLPLGRLRCDVIVAGLDSRAARQYVNQAAWRLGVSWIDAAVDAANLLARVNVYIRSRETPCLECAWDDTDYAALEQQYPCRPAAVGAAATNAPAGLGAVAAGLSAIECGKLLSGETQDLLAGRQVLINLRHHTHFVTSFRRNPACRFDQPRTRHPHAIGFGTAGAWRSLSAAV